MKRYWVLVLLISGFAAASFAQSIDFSAALACDGRVHTDVSAVADVDGFIFVAGGTKTGLRVTADALQDQYSGHVGRTGGDIFLMKLSPAGELIYSTYLGGPGDEHHCSQIAMDDAGNVYVGFTTDSTDLRVSDHAFQKANNGTSDHYIIKFSNDCRYVSSTYLGGSDSDHWSRLTVHDDVLYVFGKTKSTDFPTSDNAVQKSYDNSTPPDPEAPWLAGDITITALSLDLERILSSTYLGGRSLDFISSSAFTDDGRIILAGTTYSDNFPTTANSYDESFAGEKDGFVTILDSALSEIVYSTLIGGELDDNVHAMVALDAETVLLAGQTASLEFPVTPDALNGVYLGGRADGFVAKLNVGTGELEYASYMGGSGSDRIRDIGWTEDRECVLVGRTGSDDLPVTENALSGSRAGGADLMLIKLDETLKTVEYATYIGGSKHERSSNAGSISGERMVISFLSQSPDFPVTHRYAEIDSTNMNVLLVLDMNRTEAELP